MKKIHTKKLFFSLLSSIFFIIAHAQNPFSFLNSNTSDKTIGSGININQIGAPAGQAFVYTVDTTKMGVSGETGLWLVNNESSLREAFKFQAGISARNLSYSVSGSFNLEKVNYENSSSISLILKASEYYDLLRIIPNSITLSKRAEKAIVRKDFFNVFGTHYVSSARKGSMIVIILNISTSSSSVKQSIEASLHADYKSGFVSASAYADLKQSLAQNSSNISIDLATHYYGLKSNKSIQSLIVDFQSGSTGKFDIDKLLQGCAEQLSEMGNQNSYQMQLFLSPYFEADDRLIASPINLEDDILNSRLSRTINEYLKIKNKREQIEELLNMKDYNYWKYFYHDSSSFQEAVTNYIAQLNLTANSENYAQSVRNIMDTIPQQFKLNKKLYARYLTYDKRLAVLQDKIQLIHQCLLQSKGNCAFQEILNFDSIFIPEKTRPIYFWKNENESKKYAFNEAFVQQQLKNLKPNAEVLVKYSFTATSEATCPVNAPPFAAFHISFNDRDIYVKNPFTDIASTQSNLLLTTNANGELDINFKGWLNWCVSGGTAYFLKNTSFVLIEYKNRLIVN